MRKNKNWILRLLKWTGIIIFLLYTTACAILYKYQTKILFQPTKTPQNTQYYHNNYEEIFLEPEKGIRLHTVLFRTNKTPKGVVVFLHGNAGSIYSWAKKSKIYNQMGYDVWMPDYRGYGKSNGVIQSEKQLHRDMQFFFDRVTEKYAWDKINIVGYSMGTGLATVLAANNKVRFLILLTPYYGMNYLVAGKTHIVPGFLLKYPIKTYEYIQQVKAPIFIFHGRQDKIIPFNQGMKLKALLKKGDQFYPLDHQGHLGIQSHPDFISYIQQIL